MISSVLTRVIKTSLRTGIDFFGLKTYKITYNMKNFDNYPLACRAQVRVLKLNFLPKEL